MIKFLWSFGVDFLGKDSREKLIIIFSFILALCILFFLGSDGMELVGVIVGGWFTFLKGIPSSKLESINKLNSPIIEPKKEQIYEGEQL